MVEFTEKLTELDQLLNAYADKNPHIRPYSILQTLEGVNAVFSKDAAEQWQKILKANGDDEVARHHLAVIRHGQAFHLLGSAESNHERTIDFWKAALEHWRLLLDRNGFWDGLRANWTDRRENAKGDLLAEKLLEFDLDGFRRQVPAQLLQVHVRIIQNVHREHPEVARDHMQLIRESKYGEQEVTRALKKVYSQLVGSVESMPVDDAKKQVEAFLKIEPENVQGLCDRLLLACNESKACGRINHPQQKRIMQAGGPFAMRLGGNSNVPDSQRLQVSGALRNFYLEYGNSFQNGGEEIILKHKKGGLDKVRQEGGIRAFRQAADQFLMACEYEKAGQSALTALYAVCTFLVPHSVGDPGDRREALQIVEKFVKMQPRNPRPHVFLAELLCHDDNTAKAKSALKEAERLNAAAPDSYSTENIRKIRDNIDSGDIAAEKHMTAAFEANKRHSNADALRETEMALSAQKRESILTPMIMVLKAFSLYNLGQQSAAKTCHSKAISLQNRFHNPQAQSHIDDLQKLLC